MAWPCKQKKGMCCLIIHTQLGDGVALQTEERNVLFNDIINMVGKEREREMFYF